MQIGDVGLLLGAGFVAGAVNAVAGGGSLITFPSLLATGLSPVSANVTNAISIFPGYLASVAGSKTELAGQRRRVQQLMPAVVAGALIGSGLLLVTPERAFELVVPFLIALAALVLAFQKQLQSLVGHPRHLSPTRQAVAGPTLAGLAAVYGGYFGGALGVVLLAVLALVLDERLQRIAAVKNVLQATVGATNVLVFAIFGPVQWLAVAVLAPATMVGGYVGARVARKLPSSVLRWTVVAFAAVVAVVLFIRAV